MVLFIVLELLLERFSFLNQLLQVFLQVFALVGLFLASNLQLLQLRLRLFQVFVSLFSLGVDPRGFLLPNATKTCRLM